MLASSKRLTARVYPWYSVNVNGIANRKTCFDLRLGNVLSPAQTTLKALYKTYANRNR